MKKTFSIAFVLAILYAGWIARYSHYAQWPREGATFDEYAWPWIGISLFTEGRPMSWSPHQQYNQGEIVVYRKNAFRVVTPYLEHPPLFGIVSGGYAVLTGASGMYDEQYVNPANLRKLSLFFGMVSIVLLYFFVQSLYGTVTARIAAALYAVTPSIAVGSRLLQNENFMIPIWVLTLLLLKNYLDSKKKISLFFVAFLSGIMVLAKIPWIVIGVSACGILVYHRKVKEAALIVLFQIIFLLLFFLWGYYWDWDTFIGLWGLQLSRYNIGLNGILALFTLPHLTDRFFVDGWIYFGFFSIALLFKQAKKHVFIIIPFLVYLLLYFWAIPGEAAQGWYKYPLYPFLTIASGIVIVDLFANPSLISLWYQLLVGSSAFRYGWEPMFGIPVLLFRGLLVAWIVPSLLTYFFPEKHNRFYTYSLVFWTAVFILLGVSSSILYNEQ